MARKGGTVSQMGYPMAGQRANIPRMYLRHPASGQYTGDGVSNYLVALVHRLGRVCAPRANRVQDRPITGIHLGQPVLNPC